IEVCRGERVLEVRLNPLNGGGHTLVCYDVTKHKAIEDTLRGAKDEAERLSTAKSMFIARLSHEMRTPLHAVIGFGELLPAAAKPEVDEYAGIIISSGRGLISKIDQMLELSRMDLGEVRSAARVVPANTVFSEAIAAASRANPEIKTRVTWNSDMDGLNIRGDHRLLTNAMAEFIYNAAKYGDVNEPIRIGATALEAGGVTLWVKNTGTAGEQPLHQDLFESFGQADASLQRSQEGLGVGLTYVRAIAKLHGGEAQLQGGGGGRETIASITLPPPLGERTAAA
ncbi:MAG: sensor histidine kinase, partial [Alphaproteobacteria bacterium]